MRWPIMNACVYLEPGFVSCVKDITVLAIGHIHYIQRCVLDSLVL